jgi:GT2 family glycosyltransferase
MHAFADDAAERDDRVAAVCRRGARLNRTLGVFARIPDKEFDQPAVDVDSVPSNHMPLYRLGALRRVNGFRGDLFFGFEELEIGMRLQAHGYRLVVIPTPSAASRRSMFAKAKAAPRLASDVGWRRYYSHRNLLVILRWNRLWLALAIQTVVMPAIALVRAVRWRPRRALGEARTMLRATVDAYASRLGRTVDPDPAAYQTAV